MRGSTGLFTTILCIGIASLAALAACSDESTPETPATPDGGGGADGGAGTDGATGEPDSGGGGATIGAGPYTIAYAGTEVGIDMRTVADGKATFESGKLTAYESSEDERPSLGTNQVGDVAGDAFLAIGRWSGGTTAGKFYEIAGSGLLALPANGGFHYVIGQAVTALPASGNATYSVLAKTAATVSDGSAAPGTVSGSLAAQFAGDATKIGFSITLEVPGDATYTLTTTGGVADVSTTEASIGQGDVKGAFYTSLTLTTTGAACAGSAGSCSGAVYGFVSGANAERIGVVAHVYQGSGGSAKSIAGAIAFKK